MDRGARWATVHGFAEELVMTEQPSMHMRFLVLLICCVYVCSVVSDSFATSWTVAH